MAKKNAKVVIDEADEKEASAEVQEVEAAKAAAVAKRKATNEAKKEAKQKLIAWLKEDPKIEDDIHTAIVLLIKTAAKSSKPRAESINEQLKAVLVEAGKDGVSEMAIFKQFKIGQPEMSIKTRLFVKVKDPAERIWVRFFEDEELYKVIATGADMPEDWDGYIPTTEVSL